MSSFTTLKRIKSAGMTNYKPIVIKRDNSFKENEFKITGRNC